MSALLAAEICDIIIRGKFNVYHLASIALTSCEIGYVLFFYIFQHRKES